ncbi:hypothetical protein MMC25_006674 [Agyrium rufum]|nr:hypothetical protein [Agyrium rufum]
MDRLLILTLLSVSSLASPANLSPKKALERREGNGVGVTPAMGWNNWNSGLGSTAASALNTANAFITLGLDKLGYQYINMDDTWSAKTRDAAGNLQPDATKFPNGVKAVADQIHTLGLKFGLYGDSGTATCSGFPGSQGYEVQDAKQLAAWTVDYWKYDNCATPSGSSIPRYTTMSNALLSSGRTILYSLCNWGGDAVWTWGGTVGNSWRVGGDITNGWSSIASIAASNAALTQYAAPGGFNDFDMMEIGNGGLTAAEERAHFGLWAIAKSPLLLGTDLSKISASSLSIITNKAIIAINQDSLGKAAGYFQPAGQPAPASNTLYPYWAGPLSDGYVIGLVAASGAATLTAKFSDVPGLGAGPFAWTELYSGTTGMGTSVSATLAVHDMAIFKVASGKPAVSSTSSALSATSATTASSSLTKPTSTSAKSSSSLVTTTAKSTSTLLTSTKTTSSASTGGAAKYSQCGGIGWTGPTTCVSGCTCTVSNPYYSQCL